MRRISFVLAITFVSACARPLTPPPTTVKEIDFPGTDQVVSIEVGDTLVRQGKIREVEGVRFIRTYEYSAPEQAVELMPWRRLKIKSGEEFTLMGLDGQTKRYCGMAEDLKSGITRRPLCFGIGATGTAYTQFVGESNLNASGLDRSYFETVMVAQEQGENFQRELIYTGRDGSRLFIAYREFKNDIARPAFAQDLTFDISQDKIIGFRGARFEVIEATNTKLTYRMISNFRDRAN